MLGQAYEAASAKLAEQFDPDGADAGADMAKKTPQTRPQAQVVSRLGPASAAGLLVELQRIRVLMRHCPNPVTLIIDSQSVKAAETVGHDSCGYDAAKEVLIRLKLLHPEIVQVWADSAYGGQVIDWARDKLWILLRISKRPPGQTGFKVLPRRWIVERSLSWATEARRNLRDYERLPEVSEALITWAAIRLMTRRLAGAY